MRHEPATPPRAVPDWAATAAPIRDHSFDPGILPASIREFYKTNSFDPGRLGTAFLPQPSSGKKWDTQGRAHPCEGAVVEILRETAPHKRGEAPNGVFISPLCRVLRSLSGLMVTIRVAPRGHRLPSIPTQPLPR
jgi:hypothetical protein